ALPVFPLLHTHSLSSDTYIDLHTQFHTLILSIVIARTLAHGFKHSFYLALYPHTHTHTHTHTHGFKTLLLPSSIPTHTHFPSAAVWPVLVCPVLVCPVSVCVCCTEACGVVEIGAEAAAQAAWPAQGAAV